MVAAALIGSAAVGAVGSSVAADKAAGAQKKASQLSTDTQRQMFDITQEKLSPYVSAGNTATNMLVDKLPDLTKPIMLDQAALEATPGYKFALDQGLKSIQSSAAKRGLGVSGAALKGATQYATGLADNTYQNQFKNNLDSSNAIYNRLFNLSTLGENAAAGVGKAAQETGANIGNNITNAGQAQAASHLQTGQSIGNFANAAANGYRANQLTDMYGGGSSPSSTSWDW
jgi:hypothetical protein